MNPEHYDIILRMKQFLKLPLMLHQMPTHPNSTYGYTASDMTFLSQQWTKENSAFYFDCIDFLEAVHLKDTKRINHYKNRLKTERKIITAELPLFTDNFQKQESRYWLPLFSELKEIWKDTSLDERKLVIPLSLYFGKTGHFAVSCFNFAPKKDEASVIVLEQHAQKKEKPDYEADVDYTDGIKLHEKLWAGMLHGKKPDFLLGIGTVNTFVNDNPICRRHNVCGVVASELARRLLETNDPMKLAKSGIVITNEEVDKLHERNKKLEAKYGHFPLMVIQKNGGRK